MKIINYIQSANTKHQQLMFYEDRRVKNHHEKKAKKEMRKQKNKLPETR